MYPTTSGTSSSRGRDSVVHSRATHSVLVVEDEPVLRASMVRGLSKLEGIEVLSSGTVRDARRAIHATPPDLVIADLDLPDGSGIEVVGELDRVGLRVPIVFVSAYVGQYRGRLPKRSGTDVFEKPISLERLRRLVDERLNGEADVASSPFGVADYIQLAGMGRRSVVIEVRGHVAGRGEILIRGGEVWSARDEQGDGQSAFRRLAFLKDAIVTCRPLDHADGTTRNVTGSCESVLLEAARLMDEAADEAETKQGVTLPPTTALSARASDAPISDDDWDFPPVHRPLAPARGWSDEKTKPSAMMEPELLSTAAIERSFKEYYEKGVDALLSKRFEDAYHAFRSADEVAPGDTRVHANLERLKQMGWGS